MIIQKVILKRTHRQNQGGVEAGEGGGDGWGGESCGG